MKGVMIICLYCLVLLVSLDYSFSMSSSSNNRNANSNYIAQLKKPRRANAPGNLFVDESCIDCDTCRWMCPQIYGRSGIKSAVTKQPTGEEEKISAYLAMIACPTGSIRLKEPDSLVKDALGAFPVDIDHEHIPGAMHMGFHSASSYGATPYMIARKDGKHIVIDSPRYHAKLADTIEKEFGGIEYMVLTHRDDVQDHDKWKQRFPKLQRIIHRLDAQKNSKTDTCEVLLEGLGEWDPAAGFKIIHTPGHTPGSLCVLIDTHKDKVLFTGDSLAYSHGKQRLEGFKRYNKGSYEAQRNSLEELADSRYDFNWILPGHGRMAKFVSLEEKRTMVLKASEEFAQESEDDDILGIGYQ